MHIGEAEIPALEAEGEMLVVDPQEMQNRRLQIVYVYFVPSDVVTEVVGLAVDDAALDTTAGHPDREAAGVVIAAECFAARLRVGSTPELAPPDD